MSQQQQTNMQQQQQQQQQVALVGGGGNVEPQQVLHVRQDSAKEMEQLFAVLQNNPSGGHPGSGGTTPGGGLPFAQRKLPASFFTPPKPQHSREGSADSSGVGRPGPGGLQIVHARSRSSPAMLPHTLSALSAPGAPPQLHYKQQSLGDFTDDNLTVPLPQGWEMAKTPDGQRYYLNHLTQTTQWDDPRKSLSTNSLNSLQSKQQQQQPPQPLGSSPQLSPNVSMQNLGALPVGWDQAQTPAGEVYFINHNNQTTTWFDPRLPKHLQKPAMKVNELTQLSQLSLNPPPQPPQLQQGPAPMFPGPPTSAAQPPPPQQQHAPGPPTPASSQGQPSPGPPGTPQRRPPLPNNPALSPAHPQGQGRLQRDDQVQLLLKLKQESEALERRKEEIARQQELIQQQQQQQQTIVTTQAGDVTAITSVDPFLAGNGDSHARQNSADSGLGGMGTSYSLPRTPDDILSNVDEMESQDTAQRMAMVGEMSMDMTGGPGSIDMGSTLGDGATDAPSAMDSDYLEPSLQEDITNELMNLNEAKMDTLLTWL